MSRRRRTPRKPLPTVAPSDGTPLGHLSEAELVAELARRRMQQGASLEDFEVAAEATAEVLAEEVLAQTIAALGPEDGTAKPCPRCGKSTRVKARNRTRHLLTVAGELRLSRNYHYCRACRHGFYPRDLELKLPEEGEVSEAMERRILDFGVNTSFEEAAQRWAIHYPVRISSNLVRRVVDRVGRRADSAHSALTLQQACRPTPAEAPRALVVAADGSMLNTREGWKEAKVAVVVPGDGVRVERSRKTAVEARYVAILGGQDAFRTALKAALDAELADDVMNVVWLGDGAPENWKIATELCPFATQVLDLMHAIQNAMACAKVLLGDNDPLLPLWEQRMSQLLDAPSPDGAIHELMDCLPYTSGADHLAALDKLVSYYRSNEKRMRYAEFRAAGLPIGSGIVESAHKHVLQVRMKQAGQRWSIVRGRRMVQLRAAYRTAGPRRFHRAIREALSSPPARAHSRLPNAPRRVSRRYTLGLGSPLNRQAASK